MSNTVDFGIPYLPGLAQQPAVLEREGLTMIQALLNGVIDRDVNIPPSNPDEGDAYIIGAAPTGQWAGHANQITVWSDFGAGGAWRFIPGRDSAGAVITMGVRQAGMRVYVRAESTLVIWDGTNWTAYSAGGSFTPIAGNEFQAFLVIVNNNGGTLQHKIVASGGSDVSTTPPPLGNLINGASATYTNTPTGTDASTPFAAGGKISSAQPAAFVLDMPEINSNNFVAWPQFVLSNGGFFPPVVINTATRNINGVSRTRPELYLLDPSTGLALSWLTHLGTSGRQARVAVFGWFPGA